MSRDRVALRRNVRRMLLSFADLSIHRVLAVQRQLNRWGLANNLSFLNFVVVILGMVFFSLIAFPLQLQTILYELGCIRAPQVLMQLVTFMLTSIGPVLVNLDAVEYFAGEQAVP